MLVDDHEALLAEQQAKGQARPVDLTLGAAAPRTKMPNGIGQGVKCSFALAAEEMQVIVLA
jgi:hypothetical protein